MLVNDRKDNVLVGNKPFYRFFVGFLCEIDLDLSDWFSNCLKEKSLVDPNEAFHIYLISDLLSNCLKVKPLFDPNVGFQIYFNSVKGWCRR